uniref:Keratin n=1 Tax=Corvus moneduloides TaxID=1196302 RepID=A0A8U7NTL4_CORMO
MSCEKTVCAEPCSLSGPEPRAAACTEPCVVACPDSRAVIYPPPVVLTFPGPVLSSCPQESGVGSCSPLALGRSVGSGGSLGYRGYGNAVGLRGSILFGGSSNAYGGAWNSSRSSNCGRNSCRDLGY